jgi:hypothetical protein
VVSGGLGAVTLDNVAREQFEPDRISKHRVF